MRTARAWSMGKAMSAVRAGRALIVTLICAAALSLPSSASASYCVALSCEPSPYPSGSSELSAAITSPKAGATRNGTVSVTANVDGTKKSNVNRVEFYFDGILFATDTEGPGFKVDWNTLDPDRTAYDGDHELTVIAYTGAGRATSAPLRVHVSNTPGTEYQADLSVSDVPQAVEYDASAATQLDYPHEVTVTNTSGYTWAANTVKLSYRWYEPDGTWTDGPAFSLGSNVPPGGNRTVRVDVAPPSLTAGVSRAHYLLRFDLYDTQCVGGLCSKVWFASKGNRPHENPIVDNKAIEAEALGLERYYHYEGAEVGAGMQHLVNVASGNSLLRWTPWSLPGRGLSTLLDITYNSLEKKSESPLGNNFSLGISGLTRLGLGLDVHPNKADDIAGRAKKFIDFTDGDGTTHRFTDSNSDGAWEEPPGVHLYLREYSETDAQRKWAVTRPDRVTFFFDSEGYPTFVRDKNGNELAFVLADVQPGDDPGGAKKRVVKVTDAGGRSLTIDYFTASEVKKPQLRGKVQSITDHEGHTLTFDYYEDGNLLRITQEAGYSAEDNYVGPRSFLFTYTTSDGSGPAIDASQRWDPDPRTSNQSTRLFSVRDPRGSETTFGYCSSTNCGSAQNRWKLQTRTDRRGNRTSYAYDIANRVTTVTAPLSRVSRYGYDDQGKAVRITNPKGEVTSLTWSDDRQVTRVAEPGGGSTDYAYNDNGYLTDQEVLLRADDPATPDDETDIAHTKLVYENVPVDANDVAATWKAGRSIPHLSQLVEKTDPNGMATATPADDYRWQFRYDGKGNLTQVTDPEHNTTAYSYNGDGTLATSTDPRGVATTDVPDDFETRFLDYDGNGFPGRVVDAEGEVTRFGYDADGNLRWIQDPVHSKYNPTDNPELDPHAYRTYIDYDSFHRAIAQSEPKSTENAPGTLISSSVSYDANDNMQRMVGPHYGSSGGAVTGITYDALDQPQQLTAPPRLAGQAGARTVLAYDAAGRLASMTRPRGTVTATDKDFTTTYDYDSLDRIVTQVDYSADGTDAHARRTRYCYDTAGDLVSVTPPRGEAGFSACPADTDFTRKFEYDKAHRLLKELDGRVDGVRHSRSYRYDANGNMILATDERGHTQTRAYDQRDLLTEVTDPFDADRGITTRFEYNAVGALKRLITPRAYDASADKKTFDDYVTSYHYDAVDRLTKISLPTGPIPTGGTLEPTFVHRGYDGDGNLLFTSVPTSKSDATKLTDDEKTKLTYWDPGWVHTSKEPNNPEVSFDYRAEGWQTSRTPAGRAGESWSYFDDGLLRRITDRKQNTVDYDYDLDGNLTSAIDSRGVDDATKKIYIEATYNGFDEVSKSRHRRKEDAGDPNWHFSTYEYDANGNVERRVDDGEEDDGGTVVDGKDGRAQSFQYDANDWIVRQVNNAGTESDCSDDQRVENTFFETGWEKQRVVSRGAGKDCDATTKEPTSWNVKQKTTWDYFRNGDRRSQATVNGSGETLESHSVEYVDGGVYLDGNRFKDAFTQKGPAKADGTPAACASGCTATYAYDPRDKLVRETLVTSGGRTIRSTTYTLDAAANITYQTVTRGGASTSTDFKYVGNQLVQAILDPTLPDPGSRTSKYLYDPDGNLDCVAKGAWTSASEPCPTATTSLIADYGYDYLNRLTSFSGYAPTGALDDEAHYSYDALGRPITETERHTAGDALGPEKKTTFAYQGLTDLVTKEQHFSAGGDLTKTNTYSYDGFGHRIGMSWTPDPDGDPSTDDGATRRKDYTYSYDIHGSTSLLIDEATGKADASYGFDPYGGVEKELTTERDPEDPSKEIAAGDQLNPYRYGGKRFDTGSGTYDMGARRFGPDTDRFLQQDRYLGALADLGLSLDPLTQNRYALAGGNPVSFVESDGHMPMYDGAAQAARDYSAARAGDSSSSGDGDSSVAARSLAQEQYYSSYGQPEESLEQRKPSARNYRPPFCGRSPDVMWVPRSPCQRRMDAGGNEVTSTPLDPVLELLFPLPSAKAKAGGRVIKRLARPFLESDKARLLRLNKIAGDLARDRVAATIPGARKEVTFVTGQGVRRVDVLAPTGEAFETKVGRTGLTATTRRQIAKDLELIRDPSTPVQDVTWVFATSKATGRIGPTPDLLQELNRVGFGVRFSP